MTDEKAAQSLRNLGTAIARLREALAEPAANTLVVDGTIQRFEFVIELFWKTLKHLLAAEHVQAGTPKEALRRAYDARWLSDERLWLAMLKDRNETSHLYSEKLARQIYERIRTYLPELERTHAFLTERFEQGGCP